MSDLVQELTSKDLRSHLENQEGHKFKGNKTLCPFHDDHIESMSVNQKNGGWVWFCHSCNKGGNVITYQAKKYNLTKKEAVEKLAGFFGLEHTEKKPKIIAEYHYHDENGTELYKILRYYPKTFRADQKMNGIRQVLYHLPEVMKADEVWLVEGEKDAGNLHKLGITATTSPFGISNWKPEFSSMLKDKIVRICLDVGTEREEKKRAVNILETGAKEVKIIKLPGLENDGEDISDWIEKNDSKTFEELYEWINLLVTNTDSFDISEIECFEDEHPTDLGNARRFARQHNKNTRFSYEQLKWLHFNGIRWEKDNTGEAERKAKQTIRRIYEEASKINNEKLRQERASFAMKSESYQKINAMLTLAKSEPEIPILLNSLDVDGFALNVLNGTVDLKSGKSRPHSPNDFITKLAPVVYDPKAKSPRWESFLDEIMECNKQLISFLQKAVGYSLTGNTSEQCFLIFYGGGANGKTTFLQTIIKMLGDYAQQSPVETFLIRRFGGVPNDVARLRGTRFVSTIEVEEGRRMAESLVKALTGGDTITARFLFGEFFEFVPQFKLFIGTNHKPVIRGTDLAIWRRIRLIPFNVTIPREDQDRQLQSKLNDEISGILNWAIEGCLKWQNEGLGLPEEVKVATDDYRKESDILAQFLEETVSVENEGSVKAKEFYDRYKSWCEVNGEKSISGTAFGKAILEKGFDKIRLRDGIHYLGLKLERNDV